MPFHWEVLAQFPAVLFQSHACVVGVLSACRTLRATLLSSVFGAVCLLLSAFHMAAPYFVSFLVALLTSDSMFERESTLMSANRVCASFFLPLSSCMFSRCCGLVSLSHFSCILFTTEFYVILYSLRLEASQLSLWRGVSTSYSIHWCIAADGRSCSVLGVSLVFIALCGIGQRLHCVAGGFHVYIVYCP